MDPRSGRLFTDAEVANMTETEKARLVRIEGKMDDIKRVSKAVSDMNRSERRKQNRANGLKSNGDDK